MLDHNLHKGSLTPSVELEVSIAVSRCTSWHNGKIVVVVCDSIFEPSSVWRHSTQMTMRLLQEGAMKAGVSDPEILEEYIDFSKDKKNTILHTVLLVPVNRRWS